MLAISNSPNTQERSSYDILNEIAEGNYTELPSKEIFESVLNTVVKNLACDESNQDLFNINCFHDNGKNLAIYHFLKSSLAEGSGLSNIFNSLTKYIKANTNTLPDADIKNLIFLGTHYTTMYEAKINAADRIFTDNDIITTTSFLNTLTSLLSIPNIAEFETRGLIYSKTEKAKPNITFGDLQKIDTLVGYSNKLIDDLSVILDYKEESFLNFLESLGDFGFQLKIKEEFAFQAEQIQGITQKILSSTSASNFSDTVKKSAAWVFLNQYHDKNANDIEADCQNLFNLENCLQPDNENTRLIVEKIIRNNIAPTDLNKVNYQLVIDKLLQGTQDNIHIQLKSFSSTNKLTNFISFLRDYLKKNNTLDEVYLKKTFSLCKNINEIATVAQTPLRNTDSKLGIQYFKMIQAQLTLVLNLVKNNPEEKFLFGQAHLISQSKNLVIDVIKNYNEHKYTNMTDASVANIAKTFLDIINLAKDYKNSLATAYDILANSIKELTETCLKTDVCDNKQILKKSFEILGGMTRKLEDAHLLDPARSTIASAQQLKNIVQKNTNMSEEELGSVIWNFLRIWHSRKKDLMDKDCQEKFNLTECYQFPSNRTTTEATTILPETTITTTTTPAPFVLNTTLAQLIDKTTAESIIDSETPAPFDPTETEANGNQVSTFTSGLELAAAAAHGGITGTLNGIIQYFAAKNSRPGEQSSITKTMIIYSSMFAHAAVAATFPLMLLQIQAYIHQGNEDEAQQLWDTLLLQALPTFISSFGLSLGLEILRTCTNLLGNLHVRTVTQNTIPLVATAWSAIKNPFATAIQMGTSTAASFFTYGVLNKISPINRRNYQDVENNATEMQLLNTENVKPITNGTTTAVLGTPEKTYEYITEENFNQVKNLSENILNQLEALVNSLNNSIEKNRAEIKPDTNPAVAETYQKIIDDKKEILKIIEKEVECCKEKIDFLKDDHQAAYQKYSVKITHTKEEADKIKSQYFSAMNKLGNVFKLMETMFTTMNTNLGTATGYVKAASKSFAGDDHAKDSLKNIRAAIQFPLSLAKLYLNTYSTSDAAEKAAEKGEKRGAEKALDNMDLFKKTTGDTTVINISTMLRDKKTRPFFDNRCQSMTSDSRTHSSGSEEGSVISTGSSKDNENALIVRPLIKC